MKRCGLTVSRRKLYYIDGTWMTHSACFIQSRMFYYSLIFPFTRDTDVSIEDGNFHHICFTWKNSGGEYQLFMDGKMVANGVGLKTGYRIQQGGSVVLGQDQIKLAGDFDPDEAFVGELTEVNVWDRVLPRGAVVAQHNSCRVRKGSVNWWSQFKTAVHGGVQVVESTTIP